MNDGFLPGEKPRGVAFGSPVFRTIPVVGERDDPVVQSLACLADALPSPVARPTRAAVERAMTPR